MTDPLNHTAPAPALEVDIEGMVRQSGSSFYWAMRLLPPEKRAAMFAVYAFCRVVDDIADGSDSLDQKRAALSSWRQETENLFSGNPQHPIALALAGPVAKYDLDKADFLGMIDGMEMDAVDTLQIPDLETLQTYCDRVACTVGRLSTKIFGVEDNLGRDLAKSLGEALQLTNILRDVAEDAERKHIYLPADYLRRHGISIQDPMVLVSDANLSDVCRDLAQLAEQRFAESRALIRKCNYRDVRPAAIMMYIYHRLFLKLQRAGWRDFEQRVTLSKAEKLLLAIRCLVLPVR